MLLIIMLGNVEVCTSWKGIKKKPNVYKTLQFKIILKIILHNS